MWHDEPDEPDGPGACHTDTNHERRADIQEELQLAYVDTEVKGTLLSDGQEVERASEQYGGGGGPEEVHGCLLHFRV